MSRYLFGIFTYIALSMTAHAHAETGVSQYYQSIHHNPTKLSAFLHAMPKGGDLHNHHGGASMAENMLDYAKNDPLCLDEATLTLTENPNCPAKDRLQNVLKNPVTVNKIIDAWSMRHFHPGKESGHDHFFETFGKYFIVSSQHSAEILTEIVDRAGRQNEVYLELMVTPDNNTSGLLGKSLEWQNNLPLLRQQLLQAGLPAIVSDISKNITHDETYLKNTLQCDTANATPGCQVKVRYLYQILREQAPTQVFAQLLAGFEAASHDARIVGINMVQPEDGLISMRDYALHMQMVGYLHTLYPNVHISLHAGELTPGLVSDEGLRFHVRDAVHIAHAERIGHGIDVTYETQEDALLREMAARHIAVEINLTSNALILDIAGKKHPFPIYQAANVPLTISTDDEGVDRTNLTAQYAIAATTFKLSYATLKTLSRNALTYSFLPGHALWNDYAYQDVATACKHDALGSEKPSKSCQQFLHQQEKARAQWELERRFMAFEKQYH
jgi:adenosine deaminase